MAGFREAMDVLCVPAAEAAELFGLSVQTIKQMRLDPGNASHRTPPQGWQLAFLKIARRRGRELAQLVEQLEREASN